MKGVPPIRIPTTFASPLFWRWAAALERKENGKVLMQKLPLTCVAPTGMAGNDSQFSLLLARTSPTCQIHAGGHRLEKFWKFVKEYVPPSVIQTELLGIGSDKRLVLYTRGKFLDKTVTPYGFPGQNPRLFLRVYFFCGVSSDPRAEVMWLSTNSIQVKQEYLGPRGQALRFACRGCS